MTVSLADRGRYWCSVNTGAAAATKGDTLEYSLRLEVKTVMSFKTKLISDCSRSSIRR